MINGLRGMRPIVLGALVLSLSGCGWLFGIPARPAPEDLSTALHRDAMAAFSTCAVTSDPATRAQAAATLTQLAGQMQAMPRPTNPDHFFLVDRVVAAQGYCADAAAAVAVR